MSEQQTNTDKLVPPPGFKFNPDLLLDFNEQVRDAIQEARHQAAPTPSFEGVPTLNITPIFNPTDAPDSEIYARGRAPQAQDKMFGDSPPTNGLRSEMTDDPSPVEMWRIVDRSRLTDGTGLVSSRVLRDGSIGDIEEFDDLIHLTSHHDKRIASTGTATPFVSFSTDPEILARDEIIRIGFGIKGNRDSVVVRVRVDPDRVITTARRKDREVLLVGGVAPEEYVAAYEVEDFLTKMLPDTEVETANNDKILPRQALGYWATRH